MQPNYQDPRTPSLPQSQTMHYSNAGHAPHPHSRPPKPRRFARLKRFIRGYLMMVGALTTCYVLVKLLVIAFVELAKWLPNQPTF